jgi:peptidyl-prolyl cis-trans isomerase SurA
MILTAALGSVAVPSRVQAGVVERVIAVVGDRPILLSELQTRSRPFLIRLAQSNVPPAQQVAQESDIRRELVVRMVDEKLEEQAAEKAKINVTPDEIDRAIANVAGQSKVSIKEVYAESKRSLGLSEQEYREEIRRQILQEKLIQLRIRSRVRVTEEDVRALYPKFLKDMGSEAPLDLQVIVLRIYPGSTPAQIEERRELAKSLAARAKRGEDFCKLVADYTEDVETRPACGSRGPQPAGTLMPALDAAVSKLSPGEVTADPVQLADVMLVIKLVSRERVPTFDEVRDRLAQRATIEAIDKQRKLWLADLKRNTYVDIRF